MTKTNVREQKCPRYEAKSWTYLKTPTLLIKTPHSHKSFAPSPVGSSFPVLNAINIVSDINGSKIAFSWTWNEKRKNERDDVNSAIGSRRMMGAGDVEAALGDVTDVLEELESVLLFEMEDDGRDVREILVEMIIPMVGSSEIKVATVASY
jgi:hypothetical protein